MAAGEQQPAPAGRRQQQLQVGGGVAVEKGFPTHAQVALEVVEHQQQRFLGQNLLQQPQPQLLVQAVLPQGLGQGPQGRASRQGQGQTQLPADRQQIKATAVAGDQPAVVRQSLHHPPGHTALAHPADAAQQHAPRCPVAQPAQAEAQLPAPAHQITDRQLGHGAEQRWRGRRPQRLLVGAQIRQGPFLARPIEGGGGGLRQGVGQGGSLLQPLQPLGLQLLSRCGQGAAGQHGFTAAEVAVEGAGQVGGIAVAHRGLHRHHAGDARLDQGLGQAGGGARFNAAVTAVEHHQGQGAAQRTQRGHQQLRRDRHRLAEFILQLQRPGGAVTAEVKHVVGIGGDRGGDLLGMAHLQNLHRHVVVPLGRFHGIEDVLQLPLVVEQRGAGALIRSTHRHQHLQRPRQRWQRRRGRGGQSAAQQHCGPQGEQASISQRQHFIGQPQQLRILRLDLHQHRHAHPGAIHQPAQGCGGARR